MVNHFCQKKRQSWLKGRFGPDHPSYLHGKGATRQMDSIQYAAWKQGVLRLYQNKCFVSGTSSHLECHHLIGWWNESTRYSIENGVALNVKIHQKFHTQYGKGNNFPQQFEEFCQKNYNISEFPWRHGNHKPSFTIEEEQAISKKFAEQKANEFKQLVDSRQHTVTSGSYETNSSSVELLCNIHNCVQTVIVGNYKRSKVGLKCCASERQSAAVSKANRSRKSKNEETQL
jgi:hypothetical protein